MKKHNLVFITMEWMNEWMFTIKDDVYKYKIYKWLMIKAKICIRLA